MSNIADKIKLSIFVSFSRFIKSLHATSLCLTEYNRTGQAYSRQVCLHFFLILNTFLF